MSWLDHAITVRDVLWFFAYGMIGVVAAAITFIVVLLVIGWFQYRAHMQRMRNRPYDPEEG